MASGDKLVYFNFYVRAEPIRMLYSLAAKEFNDVRINTEDWPAMKPDQPLGTLPVLETAEGKLCESNTIARYVAKKFGLMGSKLWEEALHDLVVESMIDIIKEVPEKIYSWKLVKRVPEPENPEKVISEVREGLLKKLPYIQSIAEKRGKKFIVGDTIGLADVWFYTSLDFISLAFPDSKEFTPWIKEFRAKMEADPRIKKHLAERPPSGLGV